jgi:hypothetical protein
MEMDERTTLSRSPSRPTEFGLVGGRFCSSFDRTHATESETSSGIIGRANLFVLFQNSSTNLSQTEQQTKEGNTPNHHKTVFT